MTHVTPIPTYFRGDRFRSRLEARWAVFFHFMDIPYRYEREGYELADGEMRYLPDFWLPDQGCWIEVKGECPTLGEERKARALVRETGLPVFIVSGSLASPDSDEWPNHYLAFFKDRDEVERDELYLWCVCRRCGIKGLRFQGKAKQLCACGPGNDETGRLNLAYRLARVYEFRLPPDPVTWERFVDPATGTEYVRKPKQCDPRIGD